MQLFRALKHLLLQYLALRGGVADGVAQALARRHALLVDRRRQRQRDRREQDHEAQQQHRVQRVHRRLKPAIPSPVIEVRNEHDRQVPSAVHVGSKRNALQSSSDSGSAVMPST